MARPGNELGIIIFPHYKEGIMKRKTTPKDITKEVITVAEIIEEVKEEICEHYCKWPEKWDEETEGCGLSDTPQCSNCPLGRLG